MEPNGEEQTELNFDEIVKGVKDHPYNPDGEGNLEVPIVKGDGSITVISHGGAAEDEPEQTEE